MVQMHPTIAEYFQNLKEDLYPQALEGKYSRVFNKIMAMWGTEALEAYFADLIVDKRGGRKGFPAEVAADIILLSRLHSRLLELAGMKRPDSGDPWGDERIRHKLATEQIEYSKAGFLLAVERGNDRAVKLFLNAGVKPDEKDALGVTPMIKAAMFNRTSVAAMLIKAHSDVNTANPHGFTPLHWASLKGFVDFVELLLANGADVNPKADLGLTPLMQAAMSGHARVCDLLIAKGANVNEGDKRGLTPLHKAVTDGHVAVAEVLIAAGANPNQGDTKGVTPLAIAQRKKHAGLIAALSK